MIVNGKEYSGLDRRFTGIIKEKDRIVNGRTVEGDRYYVVKGRQVSEEQYHNYKMTRQ